MTLKPADILFTQSSSVVSRGIRHFTQHKGEKPSWASHCALVIMPDTISEAVAEGIKTNPLSSIRGPAIAFRIPGMTEAHQTAAVNTALRDTGKPYPYAKVFGLHLIDSVFFKGAYRARRWAVTGNNYCSGHIVHALRATGNPYAAMPFDLDENDPDDLMDLFVRRTYPVVWHQHGALETAREIYPDIVVAT
jgi:hypothetical protein